VYKEPKIFYKFILDFTFFICYTKAVSNSEILAHRRQILLQKILYLSHQPFLFTPEKGGYLMKTESYLQGSAQGKAEFILETLSDYGTVPPRIQEQVMEQTSSSQLKRWFFLARQVRSVEEFVNRM